jgi:hypothetical protein
MLDKKGFLFTVTVFLILIYILLSISVWVKSIEASERAYSEFYKESTVELTIEQITPEKMDNVTYIIMNRALLRLNDHSIEHSVDEGPPVDENKNIRGALFELLVNGSADPDYFKGNEGIPAEENSSLSAWAANLNASLRAIGIAVEEFEVSNFTVGQSDIDKVNYSVDIKLGLRDYTNVSSVSRVYHIRNGLDISGLVDPALARKSKDEAGDNKTIYRQFFFNKDLYPNHTAISVSTVDSVDAGQGWVYGHLALANGSANHTPNALSIAPSDRDNYILVGSFSEIDALDPLVYEQFAGFILTNAPTITDDGCGGQESNTFNPIEHSDAPNCTVSITSAGGAETGKPFVVSPGFDAEDAPQCPILDGSNQTRRCVLILNTYLESEVQSLPTRKFDSSGSGIFDVEIMRDFVMCGYYTHNPQAPSYLQRLLNDSYARNSTEFGIETFVIGIYANDYDVYDVNSRLDRELFNGSISGVKIRGLPGCKNFASCQDEPVTGVFAVSDDAKQDYGLDDIACDNGAAGCNS